MHDGVTWASEGSLCCLEWSLGRPGVTVAWWGHLRRLSGVILCCLKGSLGRLGGVTLLVGWTLGSLLHGGVNWASERDHLGV